MTAVRAVSLAMIGASLAWLGGRVFDTAQWTLYVAAFVPIAVATIVQRWALSRRVAVVVVSVFAVTLLAVLVAGGSAGDLGTVVTHGVRRLLSTEWPSPARPELVGTIALAIALTTGAATVLATIPRLHLWPLVPPLLTFTVLAALAAPAGTPLLGLMFAGAGAWCFAALSGARAANTPMRDRVRDRVTIVTASTVAVVAVLAAALIDLGQRADPRDEQPEANETIAVDPLDAVRALQRLEPPIDLFHVTMSAGLPSPSYWRTAAATDFDGEQWSIPSVLRPIGRRLSVTDAPTVAVRVEFLNDDFEVLPLPGRAVTVDAEVVTDAARSVVRLEEAPVIGEVVNAEVLPIGADMPEADAVVRVRPVDPESSELTDLARSLAGDLAETGTVVEQLEQVATTMREDFALTPDEPGTGGQRALVSRFLRDTRRGTAEQFVTGFVLLARSLGADARVAAGFVLPVSGGDATLDSEMAELWPEVYVDGSGWVVFSPVPDTQRPDAAPPVPTQRATPAAPQPPALPPPPEAVAPDGDAAPDTLAQSASTWTRVWRLTGRVSLVIAAVALPVLVVAGFIVLLKRRRRRALLQAPTTPLRLRGTWAAANDVLVDAGVDVDAAWTDRQIADNAAIRFTDSADRLRRMSTLSTAATFATSPVGLHQPELDPWPHENVTAEVDRLERDVLAGMRLRRRVRYRLSTRSLRRRTRSPVSRAL